MNLYRISQDVNDDYDTYDSAVVVAETEDDARLIHPSERSWDGKSERWSSWSNAEDVAVQHIGIANSWLESGTVICSSFNAG